MKYCIFFLTVMFLIIGNAFAHSGDSITVPFGTTPVIDGVNSSGEWADALLIQILTSGFYSNVYIKHSGTHLFVAFDSPYSGSVGIYIDKHHNAASAPQTDDVWMHGSAGPFEFAGNGNSWLQQSLPSNWNFVSSIANQISEFQISLSKLGINTGNNVLGVLFSFIDWSLSHTDEITWPSGGYPNCGNPASWANMNIAMANPVIDSPDHSSKIKVYPNLASDYIMVDGFNDISVGFVIFNSIGQAVKTGKIVNNNSKLNIQSLNSGIYFLQLKTESKTKTIKFIKR